MTDEPTAPKVSARGNYARSIAGPSLGVLLVLFMMGCGDFLTTDNPGEILAVDLRDEGAVPVLLNGVALDFVSEYDNAITTVGHFSNEFIHTGSATGWRTLNDGIVDRGGSAGGVYDGIVKAIWTADDAAVLIQEVFGDAASRAEMAHARTYGGYARLLAADNFCETTIDGGSPLPPTEMYEQAVTLFTAAIDAAAASGVEDFLLAATAGRARANLMLGNFQAARDDAALIPEGFQFMAVYAESNGPQNSVATHSIAVFRKEGGVDPRFYNDSAYATDPRLAFVDLGPDVVGEDRIRQFVEQSKYTVRGSDAPIATWQEARLIEAEAELELDDVARAIELIDEVRAAAPEGGLPAYSGPETEEAVRDAIMFERSVELFLEAKTLNDMRRTNHPLLAGRADCLPISQTELDTNPNVN